MENRVRSLIKSITFRIVATLTTMLLVYLFTGSLVISAGVGALEFLLKIIIYYLHERIWNVYNFGRESPTVDLPARVALRKNAPTTSPEDDDGG